jgi:hypothetical protein
MLRALARRSQKKVWAVLPVKRPLTHRLAVPPLPGGEGYGPKQESALKTKIEITALSPGGEGGPQGGG